MSFPTPYTVAGPVSQETIERFGHVVPIDLEKAWREEGQLVTADGFVRAIDPAPLLPLMDRILPSIPGAVPLFATAWGDLIVAHSDTPDGSLDEENRLTLVLYRYGFYNDFLQVADGAFDELVREDVQRDILARDFQGRGVTYAEAAAAVGVPEIDECIGFVLPLSAGGANEVSNLARRTLAEHLVFLVETGGAPRHLDEVDAPRPAAHPDDRPTHVPTPAQSELIERGKRFLLMDVPVEEFDFRPLPELGAVYVAQPVFGGGQMILAEDGTILFGNSSLSYDQMVSAWREGKRTPIEEFED